MAHHKQSHRPSGLQHAPQAPGARTVFVIGGARSGKSQFAENLAHDAMAAGAAVTYIATAARVPGDVAFADRIALHRARRPAAWRCVEADENLPDVLRDSDAEGGLILLDCLTLWLTRLLCPMDREGPLDDWRAHLTRFDDALAACRGSVVLVSNEIGLGVVPLGAVTRLFVDELGRLNQRVAAHCGRVVMTVAGLPIELK